MFQCLIALLASFVLAPLNAVVADSLRTVAFNHHFDLGLFSIVLNAMLELTRHSLALTCFSSFGTTLIIAVIMSLATRLSAPLPEDNLLPPV